ncbi:MAG: hypothetical protein RJQ09_17685 [Cyclobacteriaceae bacterium]
MKNILLLTTGILIAACTEAQIPNKEEQIAAAVLAAPEEMRDGPMVYGFDADGKLVTLQEGTNDLVCLADDPNIAGFNAACYHKDLDAFMARGRALKAEGKTSTEIFDMREEEAKSGTLKMPDQPTTLHILSGKEGKYNSETGAVDGAAYRYVVYIPFATSATTGLPTRPTAPGHPWIMDPGTHKAHIMITPPRD